MRNVTLRFSALNSNASPGMTGLDGIEQSKLLQSFVMIDALPCYSITEVLSLHQLSSIYPLKFWNPLHRARTLQIGRQSVPACSLQKVELTPGRWITACQSIQSSLVNSQRVLVLLLVLRVCVRHNSHLAARPNGTLGVAPAARTRGRMAWDGNVTGSRSLQ